MLNGRSLPPPLQSLPEEAPSTVWDSHTTEEGALRNRAPVTSGWIPGGHPSRCQTSRQGSSPSLGQAAASTHTAQLTLVAGGGCGAKYRHNKSEVGSP